MGMESRTTGRHWERTAADLLSSHGLVLIAHNHRSKRGELDLVMRDGGTLVAVEVRFRKTASRGSAAESVDRHKRRRIVSAMQHYLMCHPEHRGAPVRFDVVCIDGDHRITWIRDAFDAS
ncbi:MAG: YraN family protein [Gammaproteobacteria bacterium]